MIRLGKDKTDERFNILEDGSIVDLNGKIQKIYFHHGRPHFKGVKVYQIQMWTRYEWRDVHKWVIHHKDGDPLNSSLTNLAYITRSEHAVFHQKGNKNLLGFHHSEETRRKISEHNARALKGKHHSKEAKIKMSETRKGNHWFNDGIKNYSCKECPPGCVKGMIKNK